MQRIILILFLLILFFSCGNDHHLTSDHLTESKTEHKLDFRSLELSSFLGNSKNIDEDVPPSLLSQVQENLIKLNN